jgi:ABC-type lipoprotein release transport system permease subunit
MQIFLNILLYAFLAYWLYDSIVHKDYWYAFVVLFVVTVSVVVTLLPSYHADKVSPGSYPYED